ncbi:MAG: DUF4177 domain-containing protein [Desulfobulbaceae bacterium]|nr:DUF4177 domain-containing protein [Desulfobulbaceae bacterium]
MIWEYKTVLFEFSKDGLLSDRYVDDEEMENNLNQLGQQGWELVNVSLLQDGLLAFMKRPAANTPLLAELSSKEQIVADTARPTTAVQPALRTPTTQPPLQHAPFRSGRSPRSPINVEHLREKVRQHEEPSAQERSQREAPASDNDRIGGIRIS